MCQYKETALHEAAKNGCDALVQLLLAAGSEVDALNDVSSSSHLPVVCKLMLSLTVQYNEAPLHKAARNGHAGVMRLLLAASSDVNGQNNVCLLIHFHAVSCMTLCVLQLKETAMHRAATEGHCNVVELLLAADADIYIANNVSFIHASDESTELCGACSMVKHLSIKLR